MGEPNAPRHGFNLLRVGAIRRLVQSPLFPYVFQAALLGVFLWLAIVGSGQFAPEGVPAKQFAQTNLVTLVIWGLWWPAMVWLIVFFGRAWCAVCPLELVSGLAERGGRRLGVPQRVLGRWLRAGFLVAGFYALIQLLVAGVELHRSPAYTSVFLWTLLALAGFAGLFFRDRAFCRGFCPVGLLLATYSRGAMLAVRSCDEGREYVRLSSLTEGTGQAGKPDVQQTGQAGKPDVQQVGQAGKPDVQQAGQAGKPDVQQAGQAGKPDVQGAAGRCPSLLNPLALDGNADCLVCLQCVKTGPSANVGLFLRRPFPASDAREAAVPWAVMLFLLVLSGYVGYELCSEWKAAQAIFLWVPEKAAAGLGAGSSAGWIKGLWTIVVFPLLLWGLLAVPVLLLGGAKSLGEAWRRLALPMAVILAAGHMAKGLAKSAQWVGYFPLAWEDRSGVSAAQAITAKTLDKPGPLLSKAVVSTVCVLVLLVMGYFAVRESRLADAPTHKSRVPSLVLAILASAALIVGWRFST